MILSEEKNDTGKAAFTGVELVRALVLLATLFIRQRDDDAILKRWRDPIVDHSVDALLWKQFQKVCSMVW